MSYQQIQGKALISDLKKQKKIIKDNRQVRRIFIVLFTSVHARFSQWINGSHEQRFNL